MTACGVCETRFYKQDISDITWVWDTGHETQPGPDYCLPPRGMGMIVKRGTKFANVHVSEILMAIRIETEGESLPVYVIETHFCHSSEILEHKKMWDKIQNLVDRFKKTGHVVLMGDFNARAGANGDDRKDRAGKLMMRRTKAMRLTSVNHMSITEGKYSRVVEHSNGTQTETTIDYMFVQSPYLEGLRK